MMQHGRFLSGLGAPAGVPVDSEPTRTDANLRELENDDDVVGSGIFDPAGSATVHSTLGVFADHPSIPGYIARNPPFTVNKDVVDASGAQVVEVPGGGMAYVEQGGRLVGPQGFRVPQQGPGFPLTEVPWSPARAQVPMQQSQARVAKQYTVFPQQRPLPVSGFGAVGGASWGELAFAGALVGAAAAVFMGTVGGKKRR